ncbi:MAG: PPC domain-containing DNA-binding protein [Candidatus Diapherotrites archaeon]
MVSGNTEFVLKLVHGDNIIDKLKEFAQNNNLTQGYFISGSGYIKDFEISGFKGAGKIENTAFRTPYQVIAVSGRIFKKGNSFYPEMKVSLTRSGTNSINGLLLKGTVEEEMEIMIRLIDYKKMIIS